MNSYYTGIFDQFGVHNLIKSISSQIFDSFYWFQIATFKNFTNFSVLYNTPKLTKI